MDEIFLCNECLQVVRTPVLLDCQHTFCLDCAKSLVKSGYIHTHSLKEFMCPKCRLKTQLDADQSFKINEELKITVSHSTKSECDLCAGPVLFQDDCLC